MIFTLIFLILFVRFTSFIRGGESATLEIVDFYSCDRVGNPQYYFPVGTTAYFNVTIRNLTIYPKNVSIDLTAMDTFNVPIGYVSLSTVIPPDAFVWYIMDIYIPKWAFVGPNATAQVSVFEKGIAVDYETTDFYIDLEDKVPPVIFIYSPENLTYTVNSFSLTFTVVERTSTPWISYSLDGQENVTISGNTTLTDLPNGSHNIIVYANDTSDNTGSSNKVYFTVSVPDVAVVDVKPCSTEGYVGQIINITVVVLNNGTNAETFNVTAYYDDTPIQTTTVTNLPSNTQTTLILNWNTTDVTLGNYTISAQATVVPYETDITDNTYIDGIVKIVPRPDIAVTEATVSKTLVEQGYNVSINATVENQGYYTEVLNISAYADLSPAIIGDEIIIGTQDVTLIGGNSTTVTFTWNTRGVPPGIYNISAYAHPVPYETDTADNTYLDGSVKIVKPPVAYFTYSPELPAPDSLVTFNATLSTPNGGTIAYYTWNFGDTNITSVVDPIIPYVYTSSGTYNVTLTVIDSEGLNDTTWREVPVYIHDIAITNVNPSKTVIGQGHSMSINVTVQNQGDLTEIFNVTLYIESVDSHYTTEQSGTVTSLNSVVLTFVWNTTSFAKGNYTVTATAPQLPGETDTTDNTYVNGWIIVAMVGDITGPEGVPDGKVDMREVYLVAKGFGSYPSHPRWNPNADINNDDKIDMRDIYVVARNFGKTDP